MDRTQVLRHRCPRTRKPQRRSYKHAPSIGSPRRPAGLRYRHSERLHRRNPLPFDPLRRPRIHRPIRPRCAPAAVLLCLVVFIIVFASTHYVSAGSMSAGIAFPIFVIGLFGERSLSLIIFSCLIALLLLYTHRKNIRRLINHTESKIYLRGNKNKPEQ